MELTEVQRRVLRNTQLTRTFAVVSWGCAATMWLAKTLNAHPEILCLHGFSFAMATFGDTPRIDSVSYLRMLGYEGAYKAAGDVHGIDRQDVPALREAFGERFACAVVVRDPLPRLRSQFGLFRQHAGSAFWGDMSYLDARICEAGFHPEKLSNEDKLIFHGANMLNTILDEKDIGPIFRSEDLTSDPAVLLDLVSEITGREVERDETWAKRMVSMPGTNRHSEGKHDEPTFDDMQQRAIRVCVKPEAWAAYAELGYDTSLAALDGGEHAMPAARRQPAERRWGVQLATAPL